MEMEVIGQSTVQWCQYQVDDIACHVRTVCTCAFIYISFNDINKGYNVFGYV